MIALFIVTFVVTGNAYCRSLPLLPPAQSMDINDFESINEHPVPAVRLARQSGPADYNPYDMYPDTGSNPNTYPQQPQQQPFGFNPIYVLGSIAVRK